VNPQELAANAAAHIASVSGVDHHDIAIVLGSGWAPAAELFGKVRCEIPYEEIPGFGAAGVSGHSGVARSIDLENGKNVLVFLGRTHFYEGKGVAAVVHGVRVAAAAGAKQLILTNACGGLMPHWKPGTPVLISDHINFTGQTPLVGANFVDVTEVYSKRLRAMCHEIDPSLEEGIYVGFTGPQYETPAEIEMVRRWGGTLVGMSTVLEAIAAREAGLEILGLSLVTNLAAGMSGEPLNHQEVLAAGRAAATRMGTLLAQVMRAI
jgi:purine-nucleoside phosphorylase